MKYWIGLIIISNAMVVSAQSKSIFKNNPMEDFKLKRLLQDTLQKIRPNVPSTGNQYPALPGVVMVPLQGEYLGKNENGDRVYAMKPYNMPCVVAGLKYRPTMPIAGIDKNKKIQIPEPTNQ